MTRMLAQPAAPAVRNRAPLRAGSSLPENVFATIRTRLMLHYCKWDPQVEDVSTLAPFPLLVRRAVWTRLCDDAEQLAAQVIEAERELLARPDLHRDLRVPRALRYALRESQSLGAPPVAVRVMRFDFHWAEEGWRISEVNSDVPGGFAESSELPRLFAPHVPGAKLPTNPGRAWADALSRCAGSGDVALLAAPGFLEDQQVVSYMGRLVADRGVRPHFADPAQLRWHNGSACLSGVALSTIVRFYQAEWLASLPRRQRACWLPLAAGGRTPVTNPLVSVLTESKRFPLVWDRLRTRLPAWRRLLPETRDPRDAPWQRDEGWLLKTAFCNTGDSVSAAALLPANQWRKAKWHARLFPRQWVAQRRFRTRSLATPIGDVYPCVGVYTIDGRAAGAYVRLSHRPVVDYRAVDAALLIEPDDDADGGGEVA